MTITVKKNKLYSSSGSYLKTISCPKRIKHSELEMSDSEYRQYHCDSCDKAVLNTDMLAEHEIETILTSSNDTCVYINPLNPVFRVILTDEYDK
ncbi:MAG: hypothetical protein GJ671_00645 [Alteromonadaceae bacterium]|nr:hypothetical protein [Alteromonadaceae bacterium]